jgi:hypothetical protein
MISEGVAAMRCEPFWTLCRRKFSQAGRSRAPLLDKNPRRRWQAIGDVRFELDAIAADPAGIAARSSAIAASVPAAVTPRWRRAIAGAAIAALCAIAAAAAAWRLARSTPPSPRVVRFSMPIPDVRLNIPLLAISPDSMQLVYVANRQLFLRSLSEMEAHAIPGTVGDPSNPVFSPDGRWIAFPARTDR